MNDKEELQELQDKISRRKKLVVMLKDLYRQKDELLEKAKELEQEKEKEENDVERLEGRSLAFFYYAVIGKKEEKLSKEKAEAYAAAVKYDGAMRQLESVTRDILALEKEKELLAGCENQYRRIIEEKKCRIKESESEQREKLDEYEEKIRYIQSQRKEIEEAIQAGNRVMSKIDAIEKELSSAEGWGTWDLLGGGFISDMAKHSHLDDAQNMVSDLQELLRKFRTELADITIDAEIQIQIEGFMRFADYFFDGIFADWAVLDSIRSSQNEISQTKNKVQSVLGRLNGRKQAMELEIGSLNSEQEEWIKKA